MNALATEKTMTVKEVAFVLGYDESTIRKIGKEVCPKAFRNGVTTYLTEQQVTSIKMNLGKNSELPKTDLEMMLYDKMVSEWKNKKISELSEMVKAKDERISKLIHSGRTYTTSEIAKELGLKSATALNRALHEKKIQYKNERGTWLLYSQYAGKGYDEIKQEEKNGIVVYTRSWSGIGREWIIDIFNEKGIA
jgi:phage antirepressor YoqD-like protein